MSPALPKEKLHRVPLSGHQGKHCVRLLRDQPHCCGLMAPLCVQDPPEAAVLPCFFGFQRFSGRQMTRREAQMRHRSRQMRHRAVWLTQESRQTSQRVVWLTQESRQMGHRGSLLTTESRQTGQLSGQTGHQAGLMTTESRPTGQLSRQTGQLSRLKSHFLGQNGAEFAARCHSLFRPDFFPIACGGRAARVARGWAAFTYGIPHPDLLDAVRPLFLFQWLETGGSCFPGIGKKLLRRIPTVGGMAIPAPVTAGRVFLSPLDRRTLGPVGGVVPIAGL